MEFDFYARIANEGIPEKKMWQFSWGNRQRFNPIWDMVLEGSTGFSGALGRQVTLSKSTAKDEFTIDLMNALERSASEGAVVLEANGRLLKNEVSNSVELQWIDGKYISKTDGVQGLSSQEIILLAAGGSFCRNIDRPSWQRCRHDQIPPTRDLDVGTDRETEWTPKISDSVSRYTKP